MTPACRTNALGEKETSARNRCPHQASAQGASAPPDKNPADRARPPAGWTVTASHLILTARIPGIDDAKFQELAAKAKAGCPICRLLNATITLTAKLA